MDDKQVVKVLRALAEANRFRMVQEVAARGEVSCGELGALFGLSQPTVSHHLKILAEAGVIKARRDGQHNLLSVDRALVESVFALVPRRLTESSTEGDTP